MMGQWQWDEQHHESLEQLQRLHGVERHVGFNATSGCARPCRLNAKLFGAI
ncbi:hypothetical protein BZL30_5959 [Mycobacterium kansasii]|uniref:Uncharacterized protein n=1 Tax=Mycobacterium kansasii TaxID=1768 RepID=A0A1V3X058_MYCKA|nr:hypothetical protein BZL30_5959 [Mycobacterium kansasii]